MARVVIVEFKAKPDKVEEFTALMDRHGHNTRTLEEGCLVFDICQEPDEPAVFVLYEVYKDEAAHAAHRETESYKWYSREAPALLESGPDGSIYQSLRVLRRRPYGLE
jgi:(4S)-4-hydroxy-5-phosphonooxypentane-2,3-dione isomerase